MTSAPPDQPDRTVFAPSPGPAPEGEQGPKKTVMMHAPPGPASAEAPASSASRTAYIPPEDLAALRAQMASQQPAGAAPAPAQDPAARGRTEFITPEMAHALRAQAGHATAGYGQATAEPQPPGDPAARGRTEFVSPEMAAALRAQVAPPSAPPPGPHGFAPVPPATVAPMYGYPGQPGGVSPGPGHFPAPHGGLGPMAPEQGGFTAPRPAPTEYAVLQQQQRPSAERMPDAEYHAPEPPPLDPPEEEGRGPRWGWLILGGLLALSAGGAAAWFLLFDLPDPPEVAVAEPEPEPEKPKPKVEEPKPQPIIQAPPPVVVEPEPEPEPEPRPEPEPEPEVTKPKPKPTGTRPPASSRTELSVRRVKEVPLELRIDETVYRVDGDRLLRVKTGVHNVSVRPAGTAVWYSHRVNIDSSLKYQLLLGDTYFELKPR